MMSCKVIIVKIMTICFLFSIFFVFLICDSDTWSFKILLLIIIRCDGTTKKTCFPISSVNNREQKEMKIASFNHITTCDSLFKAQRRCLNLDVAWKFCHSSWLLTSILKFPAGNEWKIKLTIRCHHFFELWRDRKRAGKAIKANGLLWIWKYSETIKFIVFFQLGKDARGESILLHWNSYVLSWERIETTLAKTLDWSPWFIAIDMTSMQI